MNNIRSLRTVTVYGKKKEAEIIYNLIFQNALYSLECKRVGGIENQPADYCFAENITEDETEAENCLLTLARGKVFPVHIKDVIEDYFK